MWIKLKRRSASVLWALALFALASTAGAVSNIRNISWSPANPGPGDTVAITWTYDQPPGNSANAGIFFAPACSIQPSGSVGQTTLLADGCTQPSPPGNISGGCLTNGGGLTYTAKTVTKNITIPTGLVLGQTYQIIIAMRNGLFMNPNIDTSGDYAQTCQPYTYLLPGAKIQVQKLVDKPAVQAGGNLTYTIIATNVGASTAVNVTVQDTLPAGVNPVPVSESFSTAPSSIVSGPPRQWNFASLASGASLVITTTVQTLGTQPVGTTMYTNYASAYSTTDPIPLTPTTPAVSFSVNQATGCWVSYALWDCDPNVPPLTSGSPDGLDPSEGNLHIYSLIDNTTATLGTATNLNSELNPMPINATEPGFPTTLNAGRNLAFGSFKSRFHKLSTSYPVIWEYDSNNTNDRLGRSMVCYSTDFKFCDNKPFYTYLDYDHKNGCGTPDCPALHVGDALHIFNPDQSSSASFLVYQSAAGTGGAAWNLIGSYTAGPEAIVLIGGATQSGTIPYGDYLVLPYSTDPALAAKPLIVAKGNANCMAGGGPGYLTDGGFHYGVAPSGQKIADGTAGNDRLYGFIPPSGRIVVTALSGAPSVSIYKYTATSGTTNEAGYSPEWPISGTTGSWALVAGPSAVTPGQPGPPYQYTNSAGYYKVVVSGGSVEAGFGGRMFDWLNQGDGDFVPSNDHASAVGAQSPNMMFGKDFWFSSGPNNKGSIGVLMPTLGTQINISNNTFTVGNSPTYGQNSTYGPSLLSPAEDTAWRYLMGNANENYHVTSNQDVFVVVQNLDHADSNKAFAAPPPVILPPKFSLVKSVDNSVCHLLGDTVTYCIGYTNQGCDTSNFQIWDTIPTAIQFQGATAPGAQIGGIVSWTLPFVAAGGSGSVCFWGVIQNFSALPSSWQGQERFALDPRSLPLLNRFP